MTEKKVAKNTKNNEVYAQPIQEIPGKLMFFDRSLKPGKTKNDQPGGTLVQGLNLYTIKGLGPQGRFYGPRVRKNSTKKIGRVKAPLRKKRDATKTKKGRVKAPLRQCWQASSGWGPQA